MWRCATRHPLRGRKLANQKPWEREALHTPVLKPSQQANLELRVDHRSSENSPGIGVDRHPQPTPRRKTCEAPCNHSWSAGRYR
jgi:hypothetical protein